MPGLTGGMGGGMGMASGGLGGGGAGGFDPAAFDPSKFGAGSAGWQEMTNAAQSMMKDFLQPEKIKELSQNPEVLEIQKDPKMQEIIKVGAMIKTRGRLCGHRVWAELAPGACWLSLHPARWSAKDVAMM
jgi:hypothetical protein